MKQLTIFDIIVDSKVCTKCNLDKPFKEYHKKKTGKYGLQPKCKACKNQHIKEWREENKEHLKEYNKEYREANSEYKKEYNNQYQKNRKANDPLFKLTNNIRALISTSISRKGYKKNTKTANYLGCEYTTLLKHLNNNKYGFKYELGVYDIDHIIPLAAAKTESDIFDFSYYKNLQLLPSEFNRDIKRDRVMTLQEIDSELKEYLKQKPLTN